MDEGGIYEDGSPEQIFEHSKREKTRIFIKRLKQLSLEINSPDVDLVGFISQIEDFGRRNLLSAKTVRNMQLCFEELVMQSILKATDDQAPVKIVTEYSEADGSAVMEITYGGKRYDPLTEGDELSAMLVKKLSSEVKHSFEDGNRITVRFV